MFLIFKDKEDNLQIVNDRYIEFIGIDNDGDYVVETNNHAWEISEDQFLNIIKSLEGYNDFHPSVDCRIFVEKL